jgi:hypothetical protein
MGKAHVSQAEDAKSHAAQIKAELTAARALALARGARGDAYARRERLSQDREILGNRRAASQLFQACAAKSGFEVDQFEQIRARNVAALQHAEARGKAAALHQSSAALKTLLGAVARRRELLGQLGTPAAAPLTLDSPFLIWPTQGIELFDTQIVPWNSSAKFTLDSGRTFGHEEVGFYFLWENPSDRFAVVRVHGFVVFNGTMTAGQDGGIFPGDRSASISAVGNLHLFEWWNQPPTEPLSQADQDQTALTVATSGYGWSDPGSIELEHVFRGLDCSYDLFLIPPHGVTVIEMAAALSYGTGTDSGHVSADFNSGDFQVMSPFVSIEVLT